MKMAREYNPNTGYLSFGTLNNVQNQGQLSESYNYDALGNVKQRAQYWPGAGLVGFTEEFEYDGLNRLTSATVAGQPIQNFRYDGVGNLLSKTGVGTGDYVYAPAGGRLPHAVKSIPGIGALDYDLNGNLLSGAGRALIWTSFDMPRSISKGSENSIFMYGPEHQRARQERNDGTTTYYAGAMEVEVKGGAPTVKTYWPMGLGVEIDKPTGSTELNWTHLDRLGSVVAISNAAGVVKEQLAYDSWGKRRKATGDGIPDCLDCVTDNRGYTGHEMLDKLDLVHMNGRIYDPLLGRFMSADPLIQDPTHSQSYNRYTYVWNNPTNLTDPTGFASEELPEEQRKRQLEEQRLLEKKKADSSNQNDKGNGDKSKHGKDDSANQGADKVSANNVVKSNEIMRAVIPGQVRWDEARTDFANGNYGGGVLHTGLMVGEQVMTVLTFGLGQGGRAATQTALSTKEAGALSAELGKDAARTATQIAAEGGKHAGQLTQFLKQTPDQLRKTIGSFERQIAKHEGYIADPASHVPNFGALRPEHQSNLLHHWGQDIIRHRELMSIAKDVLKGL
ncbi:RHS repeat-associated core domain-containing protein [Massilia sp. LMS1-1-1.1]